MTTTELVFHKFFEFVEHFALGANSPSHSADFCASKYCNFLCSPMRLGGIAGGIGAFAVYPIDLVKTRSGKRAETHIEGVDTTMADVGNKWLGKELRFFTIYQTIFM